MPDPLLTAIISIVGTLFAAIISGQLVPRWIVMWLLKMERARGDEAVEALAVERRRGDVQSAQLDKVLDGQQVGNAALESLDRYVRERSGAALRREARDGSA